tara:strand:+ start:86 stop:625 length:540 start_codon:yes stop_codon:yes gene_type:complete
MTISKAGISRIKKPMKVNDIPPILKKTFFLIKEKAMPCISLPRVKIIPAIYNSIADASLSSSVSIKIKNKGAYSIKLPWPRMALSRSFGSISLLGLWRDLVTGLPLKSRTLTAKMIMNIDKMVVKVRVISISISWLSFRHFSKKPKYLGLPCYLLQSILKHFDKICPLPHWIQEVLETQ